MKHCNTCDTRKQKSEFGNRKASVDGLSSKCKTCQRVYDKARNNQKHRIEARKIYAQTDEGKLKTNKAKAEYRKRNPQKTAAHSMVAYHIRSGHLHKEPCEVCSETEAHAHHDDYTKPLNIRWLCDFHHKEWHKTNKPIGR